MEEIWIERYRPKSFDDVKGQDAIVERIKAFVKSRNIPHLLLAGPAGVGKTSLVLVIVKELYGERWKENFLELNASVTGDTPLLVRKNGQIIRTDFYELEKMYFDGSDMGSRNAMSDLEILSVDKNSYKIKFSKVNHLFRHKVGKVASIRYEGGKIKTSLNHSLIVFDKEGNLIQKECRELNKGDLLITFRTDLDGEDLSISLEKYKEHSLLRSGLIKNPKINHNYSSIPFNDELAWLMGMYAAEGCTSLNSYGSSGQIIYSLGYPNEEYLATDIGNKFSTLNISTSTCLGKSGFDRSKESSIQLRAFSTQLTKFFRNNFYLRDKKKIARNKTFPSLIFKANNTQRLKFLKGYSEGDGSGNWGDLIRISSRSKNALIDAVWLSKISGIEASYFDTESRLIWNTPRSSYIKSDLIPSDIVISALKYKKPGSKVNLRHTLRHQMYSKKCSRIKRDIAQKILEHVEDCKIKDNLKKLINSNFYVLKVTGVTIEDHDEYVYDVSVPEGQMFFGGTNPILLHNSDDRGIDVVRTKIKDFARTMAIGEVPFKCILLDECDSLTSEAQQALRRTMESYSNNCRFFLSCNYSSKIIDPIQSRCSIFRFKPLDKDAVSEIIDNIAKQEGLKIKAGVVDALYELSQGDARRLGNILQSCAVIDKNISTELIYNVSSAARPKEVMEILKEAVNGGFIKARGILLDVMLKHGLSGVDIIKQMQREIHKLDVDDAMKMRMIEKCGEVEFRLVEGSDEYVQLEALIAGFYIKK